MPARTLIQVILPLRLEWEPCYWASPDVVPGQRVHVIFAGRRYLAVVYKVGVELQIEASKVLPVETVETQIAPISAEEIALWEFTSGYYLCTLGEVYKAAYPSINLQGEEKLLSGLQRERERAEKKRAVQLESLGRRIERLSAQLTKKQEELARREASAKMAASPVTERLRESIETVSAELKRFSDERDELLETPIVQEDAAINLPEHPAPKDIAPLAAAKPVLIQSTDKARLEYYAARIASAIESGRSVLVLSPDSVSSNILAKRLAPMLGGIEPLLMTSSQTPAQRTRVAYAARSAEPCVIIGMRSSVFLPFSGLGLIVVDEENDLYYKEDHAPRYNARDVAAKLAQLHSAELVLGSCTPSLECQLNVRLGRYQHLQIGDATFEIVFDQTDDFVPAELQHGVTVVDMAAERRKRGVLGIFSRVLIRAIGSRSGRIVLIRGWERPDELQQQIGELFPGRDISVIRYRDLRETDVSDTALLAVLQADALFSQDDFRADERGAQLAAQLASRCQDVLIQTNVPTRFDGTRSLDVLLAERKQFGFPPFTRIVDYRCQKEGSILQRFFLKRDASLASRKAEIAASLPAGAYLDVDPI